MVLRTGDRCLAIRYNLCFFSNRLFCLLICVKNAKCIGSLENPVKSVMIGLYLLKLYSTHTRTRTQVSTIHIRKIMREIAFSQLNSSAKFHKLIGFFLLLPMLGKKNSRQWRVVLYLGRIEFT